MRLLRQGQYLAAPHSGGARPPDAGYRLPPTRQPLVSPDDQGPRPSSHEARSRRRDPRAPLPAGGKETRHGPESVKSKLGAIEVKVAQGSPPARRKSSLPYVSGGAGFSVRTPPVMLTDNPNLVAEVLGPGFLAHGLDVTEARAAAVRAGVVAKPSEG